MQEKILSQKNSIIGVTILLVIFGGFYFWYVSSESTSKTKKTVSLDTSLFNEEIRKFYAVKDKIKLENTSFLNKDFYKNLENHSEIIPVIPPPGRLNPFVPYVAP